MYPKLSLGGWVIVDDFHLHGCRRAVHEFRAAAGVKEPILPVPEDFVFACGQYETGIGHVTPKKIPQGAYWRKGGPHDQLL